MGNIWKIMDHQGVPSLYGWEPSKRSVGEGRVFHSHSRELLYFEKWDSTTWHTGTFEGIPRNLYQKGVVSQPSMEGDQSTEGCGWRYPPPTLWSFCILLFAIQWSRATLGWTTILKKKVHTQMCSHNQCMEERLIQREEGMKGAVPQSFPCEGAFAVRIEM